MTDQHEAPVAVSEVDMQHEPGIGQQEAQNGVHADMVDTDKVPDEAADTVEGGARDGGRKDKEDQDRPKDDRKDDRQRRRSRSRDRRRRSRSRDHHRRRSRSRDHRRRSRSRDHRRRSRSRDHRRRSRSRDRRRDRRRSRSRDKYRGRRRSRSADRRRRRRHSSSSSAGMGGYRPRKRVDGGELDPVAVALANQASYVDPMVAMRGTGAAVIDPNLPPEEQARLRKEQQLNARMAILVQQAKSAVTALSNAHREQLYIGNLVPGAITEDMLKQLMVSTIRAALPQTPEAVDPVPAVNMGPDGRYAFLDVANGDMAKVVLELSGQVQLLGQSITVSRPAGFIERDRLAVNAEHTATALMQFQAARMMEAGHQPTEDGISEQPTPVLLVEGMVPHAAFANEINHIQAVESIREVGTKHGVVVRVFLPRPSSVKTIVNEYGQNDIGKFMDADMAAAALPVFNGPETGPKVKACFVHPVKYLERMGKAFDPKVVL